MSDFKKIKQEEWEKGCEAMPRRSETRKLPVDNIVRWRIDYENDVGADEGFWEWWNVIDNLDEDKCFRCDEKENAEWLCDILNKVGI